MTSRVYKTCHQITLVERLGALKNMAVSSVVFVVIQLSSNIISQLHRDLYSYHPSSNWDKYKNQDNTKRDISWGSTLV
jgi:hypothetical protein